MASVPKVPLSGTGIAAVLWTRLSATLYVPHDMGDPDDDPDGLAPAWCLSCNDGHPGQD